MQHEFGGVASRLTFSIRLQRPDYIRIARLLNPMAVADPVRLSSQTGIPNGSMVLRLYDFSTPPRMT